MPGLWKVIMRGAVSAAPAIGTWTLTIHQLNGLIEAANEIIGRFRQKPKQEARTSALEARVSDLEKAEQDSTALLRDLAAHVNTIAMAVRRALVLAAVAAVAALAACVVVIVR